MRTNSTLLPLLRAFTLGILTTSDAIAQCDAPTPSMTTVHGDPAMICQGASVVLNGTASMAAPGHSLVQWIWDLGADGLRYTTVPTTTVTFNNGGVYTILLNVRDEAGCYSEVPDTLHVLVSATPDFSGIQMPSAMCEGESFLLVGSAVGSPMISNPSGCTAADNGTPLVDDIGVTTTSLIQVNSGDNAVIETLADLGDICMDIEHSFMGDLVLSVTCPNGQSVVLHQQGGGGTFLGDANDSDGSTIIPGTCFQYCFSADPDHGTLVESGPGGSSPNVVATSEGTAIAPGRYTPVQPLSQLVGCPVNGTWTFSAQDLWAADNGYLCGWCITFNGGVDSTFYDQGPILGTSADSSFWTGPGVLNDPDEPGTASFVPMAGFADLTYTVLDSYGCSHQAAYTVGVGIPPNPMIYENTDLGLICVQVDGDPDIQWSYNSNPVSGAVGTCFTPPGNGVVSVTATTPEGCSGTDIFLGTAIGGDDPTGYFDLHVYPVPNSGTFTIVFDGTIPGTMDLRILDMTGRAVHQQQLSSSSGEGLFEVQAELAKGAYSVELNGEGIRRTQRIVVH
ncbi:MAG: T9SS type A sorting domain-containing protein [Flavobacteriales bacterium]|nr:T9SS type A sorting domain-containing protein [Flavobacteriales bacterium]